MDQVRVPVYLHKVIVNAIILYHFLRVSFLLILYFVTNPFKKIMKDRPFPPKCISDPKHGEHKYATVNGIKLHYVEKGDNTKPLMVFVHGFPEFWYSYRYQLAEFSKDYWCVAIDTRGYGESEKPKDLSAYEIQNVVNDIKELVLYLGREKFTLVGHDWGALLGWRFTDIYGSMLDAYIGMSGPNTECWLALFFSERWQFVRGSYVLFFQTPYLPELALRINDMETFDRAMYDEKNPHVTKEDIEAYKYQFQNEGGFTPPLNYYRANFMKPFKRSPDAVIPPCLFIIGSEDAYISPKGTGPLLQKLYQGLKTVTIEGARHFIQQERPEDVNKAIRDFLESLKK